MKEPAITAPMIAPYFQEIGLATPRPAAALEWEALDEALEEDAEDTEDAEEEAEWEAEEAEWEAEETTLLIECETELTEEAATAEAATKPEAVEWEDDIFYFVC